MVIQRVPESEEERRERNRSPKPRNFVPRQTRCEPRACLRGEKSQMYGDWNDGGRLLEAFDAYDALF